MKAEEYSRTATEAEVTAAIDGYLELMGYEVLKTDEHRKRVTATCPGCGAAVGAVSHKGSGISRGIADRLVRRREWPVGRWVMIELKRPKGWSFSSEAQKRQWEEGGIIVVTGLDELIAALKEI